MPVVRFDLHEIPSQMLQIGRLPAGRRRCLREGAQIRRVGLARFDDLLEELDGVLGGPDGFAPRFGQLGRALAVAIEAECIGCGCRRCHYCCGSRAARAGWA